MRRVRTLVVVGFCLMLLGALDPFEGSLFILAGSGMIALGARLAHARGHKLMEWAFVLVAAGVAAMVLLSAIGGIGGNSGRSPWWVLLLLPYAAGWMIGLAGAIAAFIDWFDSRVGDGQAAP